MPYIYSRSKKRWTLRPTIDAVRWDIQTGRVGPDDLIRGESDDPETNKVPISAKHHPETSDLFAPIKSLSPVQDVAHETRTETKQTAMATETLQPIAEPESDSEFESFVSHGKLPPQPQTHSDVQHGTFQNATNMTVKDSGEGHRRSLMIASAGLAVIILLFAVYIGQSGTQTQAIPPFDNPDPIEAEMPPAEPSEDRLNEVDAQSDAAAPSDAETPDEAPSQTQDENIGTPKVTPTPPTIKEVRTAPVRRDARLSYRVDPFYPINAVQTARSETVSFVYDVSRAGRVYNIRHTSTNTQPFFQVALSALQQWRYEPATREGRPIASTGLSQSFTIAPNEQAVAIIRDRQARAAQDAARQQPPIKRPRTPDTSPSSDSPNATNIVKDVAVISSPKPNMPPRATKSGHCIINFDVNMRGQPINIVATACTQNLFRRPSVRAIEKWRFQPGRLGETNVNRVNLRRKMTFQLYDERDQLIPE